MKLISNLSKYALSSAKALCDRLKQLKSWWESQVAKLLWVMFEILSGLTTLVICYSVGSVDIAACVNLMNRAAGTNSKASAWERVTTVIAATVCFGFGLPDCLPVALRILLSAVFLLAIAYTANHKSSQ
jgi:allophanate hydrolase subunit 1